MAAETLPRFLELPTELQLQIWTHALEEEDGYPIRMNEFLPISYVGRGPVSVSVSRKWLNPFFIGPVSGRHLHVAGYLASGRWPVSKYKKEMQGSLVMQACRLARQMGLEWWMKCLKEEYDSKEYPKGWAMTFTLQIEVFGELLDDVKKRIEDKDN